MWTIRLPRQQRPQEEDSFTLQMLDINIFGSAHEGNPNTMGATLTITTSAPTHSKLHLIFISQTRGLIYDHTGYHCPHNFSQESNSRINHVPTSHCPLLTRFQWHTSDSVNISLLFCVFKARMFLLHCLCRVIFRVSSVIGEGKVIQSFKLGQTDEWE